jgi:hypothetical protein
MKKLAFETMMWTLVLTVGGSFYETISSSGVIYNWPLLISVLLIGGMIGTTIYTNKTIKCFELSRDFQWSFIIAYVFAFAYVIFNLIYNFLEHRTLNVVLIPGFICMFFVTLHDLIKELKLTRIPERGSPIGRYR